MRWNRQSFYWMRKRIKQQNKCCRMSWIERKKFEALKKEAPAKLMGNHDCCCPFYDLSLFYIVVPYSYPFSVCFSVFVDHFSHFLFLAAAIGLYGYMVLIKKKLDKAEKEFQLLRCEIINKSKQLWEKEEEWKNRHKVFEMMKKNYDINLYHENK